MKKIWKAIKIAIFIIITLFLMVFTASIYIIPNNEPSQVKILALFLPFLTINEKVMNFVFD